MKPSFCPDYKSQGHLGTGVTEYALHSGVANQSGDYYDNCKVAAYNPLGHDFRVTAALWQRSEDWVADYLSLLLPGQ